MSRYPTGTVTAAGEIVPWLAAAGPLSYTPENPPARDYYFQYGWILPEVLKPDGDRRHHYFGVGVKDYADEVFAFWNDARVGQQTRVHMKIGSIGRSEVTAPIAVYLHRERAYRARWCYMLVQHGSYQHVPREDQPKMEDGIVYLYRGIQNAKIFRYLSFDEESFQVPETAAWEAYLRTQVAVLSDSAVSFNSIHDRTSRTETGGINDRSWMTDKIAARAGLNFDADGFSRRLWRNHHQCFALERWVAERKFGPNFVIARTPLTNIRITTFFAREAEAKVIDPGKVSLVETVGCQWRHGPELPDGADAATSGPEDVAEG